MVLDGGVVRSADRVEGEQAASLRDTARVKLGFESPEWYLQSRSFNIRIRAETVKEFLGDVKCESILDIGCGDGSISLPLLTAHNQLTLLDMSETMLSIARARVPAELAARVHTINENFTHATLDSGSFDLIVCLGVLAYIRDASGFLERIQSLLRPGGHVIIECTDSSHPVNVLRRALGAVRGAISPSKIPLVLHTSAEIISLLTQFGFNLHGAFRYSLPPPGSRRIFSQHFHYQGVRALFGSPAHNRFPWLGSECIYHFTRGD
jgi:ubiquinone/menaquinone biosynthesis C-methylase UbiE